MRALTIGETLDLLTRLRADPAAVRLDLPDLVKFILGTGVRIGKPPPCVRQSWTRTPAPCISTPPSCGSGHRTADPTPDQDRRSGAGPSSVAASREHDQAAAHGRPLAGTRRVIFTSPSGRSRDPSNTQADLRRVLDRIGYPWVSSHVFRKTVASRLDDEGYGIRHIADQLGHARPSTTLDYYLGRRAVSTLDFSDALEPLLCGGE